MAGLKVTEFDVAGTIDGTEIVGLVKAGQNAQTTTADIAALTVSGAAQEELIRDTVAVALVAGTDISIVVDDPGNTITVNNTQTAYTDEKAQDAIGTILTDTGLAVVTYSDATPSIDVNVPAAASSDLNTGTDTAKAVTSDSLAGSTFGKAVFPLLVSDSAGAAITTGDGKAYFMVPAACNGMNLIEAEMGFTTVSSSGIPTVQIANVTDGVDMLSTKLTVDANEFNSTTAATPAVIDGTKDDVVTGDLLRIDNDVAGTGAKGQIVILTFQLP